MAQQAKPQQDTFLRDAPTFSSFSVQELNTAKDFYANTLGLEVSEVTEGLRLNLANGRDVFIYPKPDHEPATFTILNFLVKDIDIAVNELRSRGISFEAYTGEIKTDEKGIFRGADKDQGPNIAWFKDPAGNFLSLIEENR